MLWTAPPPARECHEWGAVTAYLMKIAAVHESGPGT